MGTEGTGGGLVMAGAEGTGGGLVMTGVGGGLVMAGVGGNIIGEETEDGCTTEVTTCGNAIGIDVVLF